MFTREDSETPFYLEIILVTQQQLEIKIYQAVNY